MRVYLSYDQRRKHWSIKPADEESGSRDHVVAHAERVILENVVFVVDEKRRKKTLAGVKTNPAGLYGDVLHWHGQSAPGATKGKFPLGPTQSTWFKGTDKKASAIVAHNLIATYLSAEKSHFTLIKDGSPQFAIKGASAACLEGTTIFVTSPQPIEF